MLSMRELGYYLYMDDDEFFTKNRKHNRAYNDDEAFYDPYSGKEDDLYDFYDDGNLDDDDGYGDWGVD